MLYDNAVNYGLYKAVYIPKHHKANSDGYVYLHMLVAEDKLGRPLKPCEVVHHVDFNKDNNDPDNIIVFATNGDHTRFHMTGKIAAIDDHYISPPNTCIDCGKEIWSDATRCTICHYENIKQFKMSRELLKSLIRTTPFTTIGSMYNVSDNAIRKRCKHHNLPFKSREIKLYSEIEWATI